MFCVGSSIGPLWIIKNGEQSLSGIHIFPSSAINNFPDKSYSSSPLLLLKILWDECAEVCQFLPIYLTITAG